MSPGGRKSAYTAELRLLMCPGCGAPHDVSIHGGLVQCRFCGGQSQVLARNALPSFTPIPRASVSEPERLQQLREQENRPMLPPPAIAHLFGPDFDILPSRIEDAFAAWQSARKRTAAHDLAAAEELAFLNLIFGNELCRKNDWERHRAMLESALEAFFLPRHRSVVASELCLGACRQGDVLGAETWLTLTDSTSLDLYADSQYRMAKAGVAQSRGDFQDVLAALGPRGSEIPLHDALDCSAGTTRANAWERMGRVDRAIEELSFVMARSPSNRATIERIAQSSGMCAQSLPQAIAAIGAQSASGGAMVGVGRAMLALGLLTFVGIVAGIFWGEHAGATEGTIAMFCLVGAAVGAALAIAGTVLYKLGEAKRA